MPLHPYYASRLPLVASLPDGDVWTELPAKDPAAFANLLEFLGLNETWDSPDGIQIEDHLIPGPHGDIPLRTYRPRDAGGPSVLWVHGGGFSAGELDWPESHVVSAELADRAGSVVTAVGYRLAGPEVKYPVPLDDVRAAWAWLRAGGDGAAASSYAIGGASAGAALALATAGHAPGEADHLLLAYPFAHFPVPALDGVTAAEMAELPALLRFTPAQIEDMVLQYVGRIHDLPDDALPGSGRLPSQLPATTIVLSEYDDLRPSGELLTRQLGEAGVRVETFLEPGVVHGHLNRVATAAGVSSTLDRFAAALGLSRRPP